MNAYMYQAALYCEKCGKDIKDRLDAEGNTPENPNNESTYDSDEYPKGPIPDGGGEADSYQHCDDCKEFLGNTLTSDGIDYSLEALKEYVQSDSGNAEVLDTWADDLSNYSLSDEQQFYLDAFNAVRKVEKDLARLKELHSQPPTGK